MKNEKRTWLYDLILLVVLAMAAYFRFIGVNWDENQHLHPDERFLTMVETALAPAGSLSEYFDTANSPLNPRNRGYGFFVYGDLPIVIVRYLAEWAGQTGYDEVALVGRQVSALADLGVIVLLYFLVARIYNRKTALLAATFSSLAVMQIQQSHFFTVDNPANFFTFLAIFFAVLILTWDERESVLRLRSGRGDSALSEVEAPQIANPESQIENRKSEIGNRISLLFRDPLFLLSLGFGAALGMAVASKLNALPMAILLPAAFVLRYLIKRGQIPTTNQSDTDNWSLITIYLIAGGIATILFFRIFQPYAFSGLGINPAWLANIRELQAQSSGDADVPFALQWARRSHLYSFENLTTWGLGLPLGILAWIGFLWMGWRVLKGEWKHALLWGWTALYFGWQSMAFNPTMRYQLPIYPLLCMMAAWAIFELAGFKVGKLAGSNLLKIVAGLLGITVLVSTFAWAYAFTRIYTRPHTRVAATRWIYQNLPGPITVKLETASGLIQQPLSFPYTSNIQAGTPYITSFTADADGVVNEVYLPHVTALSLQQAPLTDPAAPPVETLLPDANPASSQTLSLIFDLKPDTPPELALANATLTSNFASSNGRGADYTLTLSKPVALVKGQTYFLRLETTDVLTLAGAAPINESSWDDGLPLRMDGYDGFGGLYDGTLNFEMYWDDNFDKVNRFTDTLAKGDYIFVTSNRQWASVTRIPERFPLTTEYYRSLIGCPPDKDLIWCYNVARPGQFKGELGFELVQVYESFPTLGIPGLFKWEFNDQFAEEAFTVYDHPKVLIFQKTKDFDVNAVRLHLGMVDISSVVHLTPKQASSYKTLMLPADTLAQQRAGGTWSDLFSYDWIQNKYPVVGLVLWYGFIFLLGLVVYPITRLALPSLGDKGYPVSRFVGMLLLAYVSWLVSSVGGTYSRTTIGVVFALLAAAGISLGWMRRDELIAEWKSNRCYFLIVEGLFLAFFIFDLLIRLGNPDLWHPAKGGERPMDFSYFNAVLKSTSFPAYDPWFAGGYINYYYYGFVIVGTPVKLLGIVPSISYNLILPTLFAMVALGAFCVAWNLLDNGQRITDDRQSSFLISRFISGISASLMTVVLGNLGTVRMLFQGFQRMAAPGGMIDDANVVQRWLWAFKGFYLSIVGESLPFGRGDWYWFPSRVIPAPGDVEPITEFPFFTFLYSDLHAHMIVLPLALLGLLWALSLIKSRAKMERGSWLASFLLGGLVFGALFPTNLSDIYTYLLIGLAALTYVIWFHADIADMHWLPQLPETVKRLLITGVGIVALVFLSYAFYEPYRAWYAQAYGAVDPWLGSHTPIWSYLTQWGLFLFIIVAWMAWETREWMAATPVSALGKLRPYQILIELALAVLIALFVYFLFTGVSVGWLALPLAAWAGILLLRPGQRDEKRLVLFWVGTALLITMVVEVVVVRGDIGRMNTVFKFYLQAWILFALSAAAAFGWLLTEIDKWTSRWRNIFQLGIALLAGGAFLFTISAATDKMADRMTLDAPHTLDSMTYMNYAQHWDGQTMDLSEDYRAIRWMQDNVKGSPVIIEVNCTEYRWCTRFTIYTGLPGVVGWNWHQRQQRALMAPNAVTDRVADVESFYLLNEPDTFLPILKKYDVKYIVVGQLERILYPDGVGKFEQYDGKYWRSVYRDTNTVIYEVVSP
jgi:YYY domain-containing protein